MEKSCNGCLEENEGKNQNENLIVYTKANSSLSVKRSLQTFLLQRRSLKRRASFDCGSSSKS
jgi:hypothetical protein